MTHQQPTPPGGENSSKGRRSQKRPLQESETFKRNGPEPPENDSGPSPSVEEMNREVEEMKETNRGKAEGEPA